MTDQYLPTNINAPRRTVTVAATTQLTEDADLVIVNTAGLGAAPTITLPDARVVDGRIITIKVPIATIGSGGQNVNVVGTGGQTIDGAATVPIAIDQTALQVQSDNANWRIIGLTDADSGGEIIFGDLFLDSPSPTLTEGDGTGSPVFILNKSDAGTGTFNLQVAGVTRWDWLFDAAEDLSLERRNGAGVLVDVPISFDITNGDVSVLNQLLVAGAIHDDGSPGAQSVVVGDGSTDFGITIFTDGAGTGTLSFTDTATTLIGYARYLQATNRLEFGVGGNSRVQVSGTGILPFTDGNFDLGSSTLRWGPSFIKQVLYATLVVGDGGTDTLGEEKLVQVTAPTGASTLNLPTAVLGDDYFIDVVDSTATVLVVAAAGDAINGGVVAGTATIAGGAEGLYHLYAVDATNWRLHGPISLGPASA